jgi:hypothetical protein
LYANNGHAAGRVCPAYPSAVGQELPLSCLPWPSVVTEDNRATVAPAVKAGSGGTVSLPAGLGLVLGMETQPGLGHQVYLQTPAWTSCDLPVNATWYLRAQVDASGGLVLYVQGGTDTDARPVSLKGTPGAATGGGFDSTQVDILLAKIVTGAAGTAPAGTVMANAALLALHNHTLEQLTRTSSTSGAVVGCRNTSQALNWARVPTRYLVAADYVIDGGAKDPEGIMTYYSGSLTDGTGTISATINRYRFDPIYYFDTNIATTPVTYTLMTDYLIEA